MRVGLLIRRLRVRPPPGRQHSFVKIYQEIFSVVILSLPQIQEGELSVSGEILCTIMVKRLEAYACPIKILFSKLSALYMATLG